MHCDVPGDQRSNWQERRYHAKGCSVKRLCAIVVCLLGLGASATSYSQGEEKETPVDSHGVTIISVGTGKVKVHVKVMTHEVDIGKPSDPRPAEITSNCTYSRYPCSIVDRIAIQVGDSQVFVPRSVFADLADVNAGEITTGKSGNWTLTLNAGDASESLRVSILFDATHVMRRTVRSTSDPDPPLQVTNYHIVEVD